MISELSIILPFYRRIDALTDSTAKNYSYLKGHQIVVVLDEPSQSQGAVSLAKKYPELNWKILVNFNDHEWRNPAKAINVGIRNADSPFVLVVSPETLFVNDVPAILLDEAKKRPTHYHFGDIAFRTKEELSSEGFSGIDKNKLLSCGSICSSVEHLIAIRGYDESIIGWGCDDDNVRARLRLAGVFGVKHKRALLVHPTERENHRRYSADTSSRLRALVRPTEAVANGENWGTDFNTVFYVTP